MPNSSLDSSAVPQVRQITAEQSPQVRGSVTSRAHFGQYRATLVSRCCSLIDTSLEDFAEDEHILWKSRLFARIETMTPEEKLRAEFNAWAEAGRGEEMERHHLDIAEKTIRQMDLRPGERVLDLSCGVGWCTRLIARMVGDGPSGFGQVVGLDISDEMIRHAREASKDFDNILYVW